MKLLTYLVIICFITLPISEILRIPLTQDLNVNPLDLMTGITFLTWLVLIMLGKLQKPNKSLLILLFTFPVFGIVSLIINSFTLTPLQFVVSFLYGVRLVTYTSFFFILLGLDKKKKESIMTTIFIIGLVIVIIGYLQYFLYPGLRNLYYLGWDEHLYRMFSVFLDPNFAGAFFVFYLLFIAAKLYPVILKKQYKIGLFYLGVLFLTLSAIFLTFSRSAYIMLLVSTILFLLLINKKKLIVVLFAVFVSFIILISPWFYLENVNLFRSASSNNRMQNIVNSVAIIKDHSVIGVGFDAYRYAQIKKGIIKGQVAIQSHSGAGVDNSWLFVLATTGIIGFVIYLWFWKSMLSRIYQQIKTKHILAAVIFASIIGLFINAFFINSLFYAPFLLWVFVWCGLLEERSV